MQSVPGTVLLIIHKQANTQAAPCVNSPSCMSTIILCMWTSSCWTQDLGTQALLSPLLMHDRRPSLRQPPCRAHTSHCIHQQTTKAPLLCIHLSQHPCFGLCLTEATWSDDRFSIHVHTSHVSWPSCGPQINTWCPQACHRQSDVHGARSRRSQQ